MYSNSIELNINLIKLEFVSDISKLNWISKKYSKFNWKKKIWVQNWIELNQILNFQIYKKKIMNQKNNISKKLLNWILDFELKLQLEILI
jgi:hypothetical protein